MRAVVQRVSEAGVRVAGREVATIGSGLAVLLGVTHSDTTEQARALARKIHGLRIFGAVGAERSASDLRAEVLVVSQFTLYADTRKGRRPSWGAAAPGELAEPLVADFVNELRKCGAPVQTGQFGAHMEVHLVNDGPVTLILEM